MAESKNINVKKFQDIMRKATLDFTIQTVKIFLDKDKIWSGMRTPENNVIIFLNIENDNIIWPLNDEISLSFFDPNKNVRPYLELIDNESESFPIKISDEKLTIKSTDSKCNIHMCREDAVTSILMEKDPKDTIKSFLTLNLNDDVINIFNKIKKIAQRFDKVYFSVKDNEFFVEATDKSINYCNGVKLKLCDIKNDDVNLLFDFKSFRSILSLINEDHNNFTASFVSLNNNGVEAGMILFEKNDESEKYYLMSKIENQG